MASRPGLLTDWPWTPLGSFKYLVLAPLVIDSIYSYATIRDHEKLLVMALMVWRIVHSQVWISFSRYQTAKGTKRIVDKSIEFDQVDRERTWDDQIIFNTLIAYLTKVYMIGTDHTLPFWRLDGLVLVALLHAGPVEFIYYWFHRALHHHFLYSRYHSHHHSSIVSEPITSVVHPFAEHIAYTLILLTPLITTLVCGTISVVSIALYITYIDFMNNLGHCNFELIPKSFFSLFPPLKFLCYTPSFHSLHHTQFRTNYSLFMPMYDYIYGTNDKCSDSLYETSLGQDEEKPDAIYLSHLTSLDSIYHLRLGFASLSSHPLSSRCYLFLMRPFTVILSFILSFLSFRSFAFERNRFRDLTLHSHLVPKFSSHFKSQQQKESINKMIETAILEAEKKGVRVMSLGLLNQEEELNGYGEMYVRKHPKLKIRIVDGSSLAAQVVVHSIPVGTREVLFRGQITKVARAIVTSLCQNGIKVMVLREEEHCMLARFLSGHCKENLVLTTNYYPMIWLVGDGISKEEQKRAAKGTRFLPFSQFPPTQLRKDCFYHTTPAMIIPDTAENIDSCENWLGRRVMSAWRVGGIVHALEGWDEHECGLDVPMVSPHGVWEAALRNGFQPLVLPSLETNNSL
ncbi:PREDICTED: protein CER1-like 2 isoform X1 [Brassica oleracea var. oleracea]|uniref:protein CER1-like 2 isoform X1 n=1 Tax=Brassica oleracea var. oleracea TaxID=109376 RepID=UPI0006A6F616|nr:PREDICTED: protein CER1-like 2 isoform X1 [Brassica oleracea var. oleracea]